MSHKSPAIAERIAHLHGRAQPAHLLGWLECFNAGDFYEAHDVLEDLWLRDRAAHEADFYKGLIQLAGAFVHLTMHETPRFPAAGPRLNPAGRLLRMARANLEKYERPPHGFDVPAALRLIDEWHARLESDGYNVNPLGRGATPAL